MVMVSQLQPAAGRSGKALKGTSCGHSEGVKVWVIIFNSVASEHTMGGTSTHIKGAKGDRELQLGKDAHQWCDFIP